MSKRYNVVLFFGNNERVTIVLNLNSTQNPASFLTNNQWIHCDETQRYFNMDKVLGFQITGELNY